MAEKSAHCLEMPVGRGLSSILTFSSRESRGGVVEIHGAGLGLVHFSPKHVEYVVNLQTPHHCTLLKGIKRYILNRLKSRF